MTAVTTHTFTPDAAGTLSVSITYDAQRTAGGTDWASGGTFMRGRAYVTQSSSTTYGNARGLTSTRMTHECLLQVAVIAGAEVTWGLDASVGGVISADFWDIHCKRELIKR